MTQVQLAAQLGIEQPRVSRAVKHCRMKVDLAGRILDVIDPKRELLNEGHVLLARAYPDRFGRWDPPARDVPREAGAADRLGSAARSA